MVRQIKRLPVIENVRKGIQAVLVLIVIAILYINYESITQLLKKF